VIPALEPDLLAQLATRDHEPSVAVTHDDDLAAAVRTTARMRRAFYTAVLLVALYGTATGAVAAFDLPWWIGVSGVFALELGGMTFLSHADVRRRLGEHATGARLLGALIAGAAAAFNLVTHDSRMLGGFFALMSGLGFISWWIDVESKRRDRLRAHGMTAEPPPRYGPWCWIRHPALTAQARALALRHPQLGRTGSLQAAQLGMRRHRRNTALAAALQARIRDAVGPDLARIAVLTYDMNEVARRLQQTADYDGLTALLGADLTAAAMQRTTAGDPPLPRPAAPPAEPSPAGNAPGGQPNAAPANALQAQGAPATSPPGLHAVRQRHRRPPARRADPVPGPDPGSGTVAITVLDTPAVLGADGRPVSGVRAKSLELLALLAAHRAGATTADILAAVWPGVPAPQAAQRLSTCVSNLRGVIRSIIAANGQNGERIDPIVNTGGRYHLNPSAVTVDCWHAGEPSPPPHSVTTG